MTLMNLGQQKFVNRTRSCEFMKIILKCNNDVTVIHKTNL